MIPFEVKVCLSVISSKEIADFKYEDFRDVQRSCLTYGLCWN